MAERCRLFSWVQLHVRRPIVQSGAGSQYVEKKNGLETGRRWRGRAEGGAGAVLSGIRL